MLKFIKSFFGFKDSVAQAPEAPYKVETPAPTPEPAKCGCGRSSTGLCVGLHKLTAEAWAAHPDNPAKSVAAPAKKTPAKKTPVKKTPAAKPAAVKAAPKTSTRRTKKPAQ